MAEGGGGGACLGAIKSSLATDLLGALGRVADRGGGTTSKLARGGGSGLERLVSRDMVLCASTNEPGTDEVDTSLLCDDCAWAALLVGVGGSGVDCLDLAAAALRESPRSGRPRSACRGGTGVLPGIGASLRLGSSNGLIPEFCEATEIGETGLLGSLSLLLRSAGETTAGNRLSDREFFRESARFEVGTSPRRNPSCGLD